MTSIQIDRLDGLSSSVAIKRPCRVATVNNISLTGLQTVNGVSLETEDPVLVKAQTDASENGIWIADTGPWRRSKDFNKTGDVVFGTIVVVGDGTDGSGVWSVSSPNPINVGESDINFVAFIDLLSRVEFITPQLFGAVGDGVADDTEAWEAFQSATGLKAVPYGEYLKDGEILRFDQGIIGNGVFDDDQAAWDQVTGDRERDSLIVHGRTIDANSTLVSPTIKLQTIVNYEVDTPSSAFKRIINKYSDMTLNGYYDTDTDQNNNFTSDGAAVRNNMAGLFGALAGLYYISDAKESENPDIVSMGATKNGCLYLQPTRRAKYDSGGYMFGCEVIVLNTSDDIDTPIPYTSNDEFNYTSWTAAHKMSVQTNNCPASTIILMTGSTTARHGTYAGITIGASLWAIDDVREGPEGTVGINMASWRSAVGYADIGVKYRTANRHHYYREGAKIRSSHSRYMYEAGSCGISIEGQTGETQYLNFRDGATTAADGGSVTDTARLLATSAQFTMSSPAGELIFSPIGVASFRMNSARLAPVTDNAFALGASGARFTTVYAATGTIDTSDERLKVGIAAIDDAALDAWGDVNFAAYQFTDAVAEKGDGARIHFGVVAQRVKEAFEAKGLDPFRYGLLCYDKWEGAEEQVNISRVEVKPAVYEQVVVKQATYRKHREKVLVKEPVVEEQIGKDGVKILVEIKPAEYQLGEEILVEVDPPQYEDGELISPAVFEEVKTVLPAIEAGDRYGIRYEEALCIEAAYQRRRAERLEARVAAIETALGL